MTLNTATDIDRRSISLKCNLDVYSKASHLLRWRISLAAIDKVIPINNMLFVLP